MSPAERAGLAAEARMALIARTRRPTAEETAEANAAYAAAAEDVATTAATIAEASAVVARLERDEARRAAFRSIAGDYFELRPGDIAILRNLLTAFEASK